MFQGSYLRGTTNCSAARAKPSVRKVASLTPEVRFGRASNPCPPCISHLSGTRRPCPLWPRLQTCLPCFLRLPHMCPLFVRHAPALCQLRSTMRSRLCPLVAVGCCGAGPWHHKVEFFLNIAQPTAFIAHAHWSVSLAFILVPQIRPLQAHPTLQNLFGVYAGIIPKPFTFLEKNWPRYALAASPDLVRHVSALCPPGALAAHMCL